MSLLELAQPRYPKPHAPVAVPDADIVVLKFGSSVLCSPDDVPAVVSETYAKNIASAIRQGTAGADRLRAALARDPARAMMGDQGAG